MDSILFSANPALVKVDDAIRHLSDHEELYWEVGFRIAPKRFSYPILGYIHVCGGQVEYKVTIRDILPFSRSHYEDKELSERVKPSPWLKEWAENFNDMQSYPWKFALAITHIEPFSCDTYGFRKHNGSPVKRPPQNYVRVKPPSPNSHPFRQPLQASRHQRHNLAEKNLEDFVVQQLEEIETGLKLVSRQLSTAAGRLDLLCQDDLGCYVVVELKRAQGTDQVVGQILRYMGWVQENYRTEKVRGIIVVGKKDRLLSYAAKAVPNVQVKEFRLSIR